MSADFKPVSNGFNFVCTSSYNLEETANESQIVQATHVDLIGELTSEANTNMINADNLEMEDMPEPPADGQSDPNYSTDVQEWQTQYNLINTTGQMYVNELQTEAQNDATNLQAIGNFIQNLLSIQSAILSPLDTVTALLQKDL
ncbi:MAG: hypothetical protein H7A41_03710 [Chlamydiales bacterium]|nr:hypothetical protein [Chlamydiia bacterium]MCP5504242.1 hypothetical protein [Chlamydiales bacterium]